MDRRRRRISAAGSRTVRDTGKKEVGGERLKSKIQQYCLILRDRSRYRSWAWYDRKYSGTDRILTAV